MVKVALCALFLGIVASLYREPLGEGLAHAQSEYDCGTTFSGICECLSEHLSPHPSLKCVSELKDTDDISEVHEVTQYLEVEGVGLVKLDNALHKVNRYKDNTIICFGTFYTDIPAINQNAILMMSEQAHLVGAQYMIDLLSTEAKQIQAHQVRKGEKSGQLVFCSKHGEFSVHHQRLCYKLDLMVGFHHELVYMDAVTNEIVKRLMKTYDVKGHTATAYYGEKEINVSKRQDGKFEASQHGHHWLSMRNCTTTDDEKCLFDKDESLRPLITSDDKDKFGKTSNHEDKLMAAYYGAQVVENFYWREFKRNHWDGKGGEVRMFGLDFHNAFWTSQDGVGYTAYGYLYDFGSLDVVGHELTHGVVEGTANLEYHTESGALNEGFADIFGQHIYQITTGKTWMWLHGTEKTSHRSMSYPKNFNQPDTYKGINWYEGEKDEGGVHTNSGVINFWFFLVSEGGAGKNDKGDRYFVHPIGQRKAIHICYRALKNYMGPKSDYHDAREALIQSARDLFGRRSREVRVVARAFHAVGVGRETTEQ